MISINEAKRLVKRAILANLVTEKVTACHCCTSSIPAVPCWI